MHSPNKRPQTAAERLHVARVKALACSVCDVPGPSEDHEIKQGQWFTSCALCASCHRGPILGWHGGRRIWAIKKMDEIDALAVTIRRLMVALG